jgi:hypothetical protein
MENSLAITCEQCTTRPVEYRLDEGNNTFEVSATLIGLPTVREPVRLKPGAFCKRCLKMALESKSNALFDRERTRRWYREEANRRAAANDPFRCSDCHRPCDEWVSLPDPDTQEPVGRCHSCLYTFFRNDHLKKAARLTRPQARTQAMVAAFETAKREARYVFDFAWA